MKEQRGHVAGAPERAVTGKGAAHRLCPCVPGSPHPGKPLPLPVPATLMLGVGLGTLGMALLPVETAHAHNDTPSQSSVSTLESSEGRSSHVWVE